MIRKVLVEKTTKRKAKELKENIENKGDEEIGYNIIKTISPGWQVYLVNNSLFIFSILNFSLSSSK